jgi:chromosome segregation ATPase
LTQDPTPQAPTAPAIAGTPARGARTAPSASAIYEGFRAQRRELRNQLDELEGTRREITSQLEDVSAGAPERAALETRMKDVDSRIANVDKLLAGNAVQLSQAAGIPGAVVEPPRIIRQGPPEEAYIAGMVFMVFVLLPLSIALARRIWRRSAAVVTSLPRDISERLQRMEHALEATAVEVERIGEGQRFLTRLFTEGDAARAIGSGAAQPLQSLQQKIPERLP